jgi:dihydropteroate synthase
VNTTDPRAGGHGTGLWFGARHVRCGRSPLLMGVVNVTPDSFSDGGVWLAPEAAVRQALQLVEDGADLLDVGGESTRPGAAGVAAAEELRRVLPVLQALRPRVELPLSIDTTKAEVARAALDCGADVVNDVSGLRFDAAMVPLVAAHGCGVVVVHMRGEPRTMQDAPRYDDVVHEVRTWLEERLAALAAAGIAPARVYVDPGIGFGKRLEDNLALLRQLDLVRAGGRPLVVGASRKRFLGTLLDEPDPKRRLEGDLAVAAHARAARVDVLRVHDVRAVRRLYRVLDALDPAAAPAPGDAVLDPRPRPAQ